MGNMGIFCNIGSPGNLCRDRNVEVSKMTSCFIVKEVADKLVA